MKPSFTTTLRATWTSRYFAKRAVLRAIHPARFFCFSFLQARTELRAQFKYTSCCGGAGRTDEDRKIMRCIAESSQIFNTWAEANALDMMIQEAGAWATLRGYEPGRHVHAGDTSGPVPSGPPHTLRTLQSCDAPGIRSEVSPTETETVESGSTSSFSQCSTTLIAPAVASEDRSGSRGGRPKARRHDKPKAPARSAHYPSPSSAAMRARRPVGPKA